MKPKFSGDVTSLASGSNALAFDLYAEVRTAPGNLAFSPASISAALAMTFGGARGETEAQMKRVLHLAGDRDATATAWGALARGLQGPARPFVLRMANRLFGEQTMPFQKPFADQTKAAFGAPLEATDFRGAFETARLRINGWVEEQTERRIRDLLPQGAVDTETRLVLVNAIYFLADWALPFTKEGTCDDTFHLSAAVQRTTPMMHGTAGHGFAQAGGVKILELDYVGGDAAMLVILPDEVGGLADVEKSLTTEKLVAWRGALKPERVAVSLPRFEVNPSTSMSLGGALVKLGMPDAFDREKADFTGIANPPDPRDRLNIDKVLHKAFVKVDEKGTEAAAATAVLMAVMGRAPPPQPLLFNADHPFLFAIVDKPTGLVLFLGRVSDPTTT